MRKSLWSPDEDAKLKKYVTQHGYGNWSDVAKHAGLQRCGKSCRLRWLNYLRPDLKRGKFTPDEIRLIVKLHKTLGNSWSKIAACLPGRTDNDIKNFWHSYTRSTRRVVSSHGAADHHRHHHHPHEQQRLLQSEEEYVADSSLNLNSSEYAIAAQDKLAAPPASTCNEAAAPVPPQLLLSSSSSSTTQEHPPHHKYWACDRNAYALNWPVYYNALHVDGIHGPASGSSTSGCSAGSSSTGLSVQENGVSADKHAPPPPPPPPAAVSHYHHLVSRLHQREPSSHGLQVSFPRPPLVTPAAHPYHDLSYSASSASSAVPSAAAAWDALDHTTDEGLQSVLWNFMNRQFTIIDPATAHHPHDDEFA